MKYYCCNDAICICASCCLIGEHKGHKVEALGNSSEQEKEKLGHVLEQLISRRDIADKRVQRLVEQRRGVAGETERVTARFRGIREQLEALEAKVLLGISIEGLNGRRLQASMLLDINSAANGVAASWDKKTASYSLRNQGRPKTPTRFKLYQALSSSSFSLGRHYWDVEVSESGYWRLGVAYPSIDRKGDHSWFGYNEKSWCLCREDTIYTVIHNSQLTNLPHKPTFPRIRISLDYEAGRLSFFEMSEPIRHLHTFTATFTESGDNY
uniref:B30.2/SPRY domain-containing protein n=1 Tax=Xenopus tropicalis TaxID=8364 RepID=A0A1B8Y4K0_XENTR